MAEVTPSTLCSACEAIFQQSSASKSDSTGEIPHHGLEVLAERASQCHLCLTVFMSIDPDAYKAFRSRGSAVDSVGFAWISPIARDQARLKFRYVKPSKAPISPNGDKENRGPTPSSNGSKASLLLNWDETNGLVVELILMHPKCESLGPSQARDVTKLFYRCR